MRIGDKVRAWVQNTCSILVIIDVAVADYFYTDVPAARPWFIGIAIFLTCIAVVAKFMNEGFTDDN